jgi:hypothetical protein
VCADSIGYRIFYGSGGQMDFVRGAAQSEGERAIIALPSTAQGGTVFAHRFGVEARARRLRTRSACASLARRYAW